MCRSLRCDRRWLQMARNVLERNNIAGDEFSEAIRNPLDKGRGKYRNLYLKGASNCGGGGGRESSAELGGLDVFAAEEELDSVDREPA